MSCDLGEYFPPVEHYALLRHVVGMASGTAVEFGVGKGESTRIIAEHMPVIGFGSTKGLPGDWRDEFPAGSFAFPLPDIPNATLIDGLFEDTVPGFDFDDSVGLVHVDCDLYESTKTALAHVPLRPGCFIVFDEFHGYVGAENHEQRAWQEYVESTGVQWSVIGHSHEAWAIRIEA